MKEVSKLEPSLFTFKPDRLLRDKDYASPRITEKSKFIEQLEAMQHEARIKRSEAIAAAKAVSPSHQSQGSKVLRLNRLSKTL